MPKFIYLNQTNPFKCPFTVSALIEVQQRYAVHESDTTMFSSITKDRNKIKNPLPKKWAIKLLSPKLITVMIYFKRTIFCYT